MKTVKKFINRMIDELDEKNKLIEMQNLKIQNLQNELLSDSRQTEKDKAKEEFKDNVIRIQAKKIAQLENQPVLLNDFSYFNYLYFDDINNTFLGYKEELTFEELEKTLFSLSLIWQRKNNNKKKHYEN